MDENKRLSEVIKGSYHNHTYLCGHAKGSPIDYVKVAFEKGLKEIGISDHAPMPFKPYKQRMDLDSFENVYLKEIEEAQLIYKDKIVVYKALEIEYFENHDDYYKYLLSKVDYLILGAHLFPCTDNTLVDGDIFSKEITTDILLSYTENVIKGIKSGYFKILAHPDIFMYRWTDWNKLTTMMMHKIFKCAEEYGIIVEMNANGARRGTRLTEDGRETFIYPRLEAWEIAKEYDLKIIISDDAHYPEAIHDDSTRKVYELSSKLKLNILEKL